MQLGAQNKLILGPKRASWGPNKHQLTCVNFAKPEQTNPLESLPIEGYDRPNDFLQGLTNGRGERIRTSGLYVPNVALYQAKLHPDTWAIRCCAAQKEENYINTLFACEYAT